MVLPKTGPLLAFLGAGCNVLFLSCFEVHCPMMVKKCIAHSSSKMGWVYCIRGGSCFQRCLIMTAVGWCLLTSYYTTATRTHISSQHWQHFFNHGRNDCIFFGSRLCRIHYNATYSIEPTLTWMQNNKGGVQHSLHITNRYHTEGQASFLHTSLGTPTTDSAFSFTTFESLAKSRQLPFDRLWESTSLYCSSFFPLLASAEGTTAVFQRMEVSKQDRHKTSFCYPKIKTKCLHFQLKSGGASGFRVNTVLRLLYVTPSNNTWVRT